MFYPDNFGFVPKNRKNIRKTFYPAVGLIFSCTFMSSLVKFMFLKNHGIFIFFVYLASL